MPNSSEKDPEFSRKDQWEAEACEPETGIEFDLGVLAHIMKGNIVETRKVGEMRLVKIAAQEGEDLLHNGFKITAKTVLIMVNGKSEPELLAGEYAHTINENTLKVMFNCVGNAEQFRKFSNELYGAYDKIREIRDNVDERTKKIVEIQKGEEKSEIAKAPQAQEVREVRNEVENAIKPRF